MDAFEKMQGQGSVQRRGREHQMQEESGKQAGRDGLRRPCMVRLKNGHALGRL